MLTDLQIQNAITSQLTNLAQSTDLLTATDISNAVDNTIGNLALSANILTDKQIESAITSQLSDIAQGTDLLTADDISTAVDNVIGNLALSGSVLTDLQIQGAITSQLTNLAQSTDLLTATDISNAVDNVIGDLATTANILTDTQIQEAISGQLSDIAQTTDILTADDISTAVSNVIGGLALSSSVLSDEQIQAAITSQLTNLAQSTDLLTATDISTAVDTAISGLATKEDVLTDEELATAVETEALGQVVTPDDLLSADDISGAVDAAIGPDGLNLAESTDVLTAQQIRDAVTTQMQNLVAQGEPVTQADIQAAIEAEAVVLGQVVSVEDSGLATAEQVQGVQDTINQVADFIGIPANEVTQQDLDAFATVIADFEMDAEMVAQQDMLRYDVNADGIIDTTDQDILEEGLAGDYSRFAPEAQFNPATGMFLQRQQDQQRIAELEQQAIDQEAEFELQRQQDMQVQADLQAERDAQFRADIAADAEARDREAEREEYLRAFTAPGRTRTTRAAQDPADIRYFYDIGGDEVFANQQQSEFYGGASPFGDNFMNEILTPPRRKAKGGLIDKTDEILKILGE